MQRRAFCRGSESVMNGQSGDGMKPRKESVDGAIKPKLGAIVAEEKLKGSVTEFNSYATRLMQRSSFLAGGML
jgi:hypothetical protein